jgi:hypothetical protein
MADVIEHTWKLEETMAEFVAAGAWFFYST